MSREATMDGRKLSQREIEALVDQFFLKHENLRPEPVALPTAKGKTVKLYDFRRPDKFSKDHLRALRIINGSFARLLSSSFTSYLRTAVQVKPGTVEQATYDEYIRSLSSPTVTYVVTVSPLPGQAVVELNLPVAQTVLDRLLGGAGVLSTRPREMTEIELTLLEKVGVLLLNCVREAWANVVRLQPTIQEPVLTPEFVHVTLPGETTVSMRFEVSLLNMTGGLSICIPHPVLQPVLEALTSQVWVTSSARLDDDDDRQSAQEQLTQVDVPVTALLGRTQLTLRDLLALNEGTILKLDTAANGALPVRVGEHVKFHGRPGVNGKNLAIKIERILSS
jgi:flagellar motor switch protein FliM